MDTVDIVLKVARASQKAGEFINKTVDFINRDAVLTASRYAKAGKSVITFGVKNTRQISRTVLGRLGSHDGYIWHTIDGLADGGRAVDVKLTNPLTGRIMTGSSGATAVNVLWGINDIGICTDGGGSVLAPALSLNLFSIMAKGLGLAGQYKKSSTDKISFVPGIGVISHDYYLAKKTTLLMAGLKEQDSNLKNFKIAVCEKGNIILPDGTDMRLRLDTAVNQLKSLGLRVYEESFPDFYERQSAIEHVKRLFGKYDILLTLEGPIDLIGFGDSVFGSMGSISKSIQNSAGKYIVKIANMVNATAVTIPFDDIATGLVITARPGEESGLAALKLADILRQNYSLPQLYYDYFNKSYLKPDNNIIFALEEFSNEY